MSNTNRHGALKAVSECVNTLIHQLTPDPETVCKQALRDLGTLTSVAKTITSDDVPAYFREGIQAVINQLDAFRTGFARTAEQENNNLQKQASYFKPKTAELSVDDFVKYANDIVHKAIRCADNGALGSAVVALQTLAADIAKAESFEDTKSTTISVTIDHDPMRTVETETSGTTSPSGTSAPSTAASNYATNPGAVTAAPPSTEPNSSTSSAANATSSTPAGDSNYVAKGDEPKTEPTKTEPAAAVDPNSVAKGIDAIREAVAKCEPLSKAQAVGWPVDLNTPSFMRGSPTVSF